MVMTVECPSCHTTFPVDPAKVPEGGVKVRCSACSGTFRVERPDEGATPDTLPADIPAAEAPPVPEGDRDRADETDPEAPDSWGEDEDDAPEGAAPAADPFAGGVTQPDGFTTEAAEPAEEAAEEPDDWVVETEDGLDAGGLEVEPVGTVEETVADARDEPADFGAGLETSESGAGSSGFEIAGGDAPVEADTPGAGAPADEPAAPSVQAFSFGQRDPKEKAKRLARVLVSDMIMYNPERHERALANGTLRDDFEDEIAKSWKEYVEQIGEDVAESTSFWTDALNDVLAKGEKVF